MAELDCSPPGNDTITSSCLRNHAKRGVAQPMHALGGLDDGSFWKRWHRSVRSEASSIEQGGVDIALVGSEVFLRDGHLD